MAASKPTFLHAACPADALCPEPDPALHRLWHDGRFGDCEKGYRSVLAQCSRCPNALFFLASCLHQLGRAQEADLIVERLLPHARDEYQLGYLFYRKGLLLEKNIGRREATPWFKAAGALEGFPGNLSLLAQTMRSSGQRRAAVELAEEALRELPFDPATIARCAALLVKGGHAKSAKRYLLELAKKEYDLPHFYATVAYWLVKAGGKRRGFALARKTAKAYPESVVAAASTAQLFMDAQMYASAVPLLRRLLKLDPAGHGKASLMNLAHISGHRGDTDRLVDYAVRAAREYEDDETRKFLRLVVRTVTGESRASKAAVDVLAANLNRKTAEHEALQSSVAGYDLTEEGSHLDFALGEGEGWHVEFTNSMPEQARDLGKEIAAFSSQTDGGTIFIGVADDTTVVGVANASTATERDAWRKRVRNIATKTVQPPNPVTVYFNENDGKTVVKIWVREGSAPIYYVKNAPYIRNLDESRKATPEEVEEFIARRSKR